MPENFITFLGAICYTCYRIKISYFKTIYTVLFDGPQVLEANELEEMDTNVSGTVDVKGFGQFISHMRDQLLIGIRILVQS